MKPLYLAALCVGAIAALSCDQQTVTNPQTAIPISADVDASGNPCTADRDHDKKTAPVEILCAITVSGNPLTNVAKAWFSNAENRLYIADQSNQGVDIIDLRNYAYEARIPGFVGVPTAAAGGTATTNGQGPNSMALGEEHRMWVSDGNSQVQLVNLRSRSIIATVNTAITDCDGGTATTHYCGRTNEMTYDPRDRIVIVVNPNPLNKATGHAPLPPYVTFISGRAPYPILGRISFPDARGTPEAPVWNPETQRFLLSIPTCNSAALCGAGGATEYIAVINPRTLSVVSHFDIPNCATLFPGVTPVPVGMMNDMSIDVKHQHVIMPVCGRGEVVFNARTGAVVNVVNEIAGSDETWFNDGDDRFYLEANDPNNANTRSLGVVDGRTGLWLQNVATVGGVIPAASDEPANRVFITSTASTATTATACTPFGFQASGCVIVFEHEDGRPEHDGHGDGEHGDHGEHGEHGDD